MKKCLVIALVVISTFFASQALAHYLWLNVDNYHPDPNEEITISVGWGHKFPQDGQPRAEMAKKLKLFLVSPSGEKIPLKTEFQEGRGIKPVKVRLKNTGIYLAVLTLKTFVSKTVEGYFYKPKNELKDVILSKWYESTAVAIINVGQPQGKTASKELKECNYQIVPLKNPAYLKKGEILPVRVIFKGKPFHTWVYATYAGFSKLKDTFAWTTRTGKDGIASIKILNKGIWLVKADAQTQFSDPKKADISYFIATLTFGL